MGNQQANTVQYKNYAYRITSLAGVDHESASPAQLSGLQPYIDYILYNPELNDNVLLSEYLLKCVDKLVQLDVYNMVTQSVRQVTIVPQKLQEGFSQASTKELIGAEVKFERFDDAHEKVYQVDNVQQDSPAYTAGLGFGGAVHDLEVQGIDFIISGNQQISRFEDSDQLALYLSKGLNTEVTLQVYNTSTQTLRTVFLTPKEGWGGNGIVGCQILNGLLTRIPKPRSPDEDNEKTVILEESTPQSPYQEYQDIKVAEQRVYVNDDPNQSVLQIMEPLNISNSVDIALETSKAEEKKILSVEKVSETRGHVEQEPEMGVENLNSHNKSDFTMKSDVRTALSKTQAGRHSDQRQTNTYRIEEDEALVFHRSDGKNSEFLLFNA